MFAQWPDQLLAHSPSLEGVSPDAVARALGVKTGTLLRFVRAKLARYPALKDMSLDATPKDATAQALGAKTGTLLRFLRAQWNPLDAVLTAVAADGVLGEFWRVFDGTTKLSAEGESELCSELLRPLSIFGILANWHDPPAWAPSTAYALGQPIMYDGNFYICTQAGESAPGSEPGRGGPNGRSAAIKDGTEWRYVPDAQARREKVMPRTREISRQRRLISMKRTRRDLTEVKRLVEARMGRRVLRCKIAADRMLSTGLRSRCVVCAVEIPEDPRSPLEAVSPVGRVWKPAGVASAICRAMKGRLSEARKPMLSGASSAVRELSLPSAFSPRLPDREILGAAITIIKAADAQAAHSSDEKMGRDGLRRFLSKQIDAFQSAIEHGEIASFRRWRAGYTIRAQRLVMRGFLETRAREWVTSPIDLSVFRYCANLYMEDYRERRRLGLPTNASTLFAISAFAETIPHWIDRSDYDDVCLHYRALPPHGRAEIESIARLHGLELFVDAEPDCQGIICAHERALWLIGPGRPGSGSTIDDLNESICFFFRVLTGTEGPLNWTCDEVQCDQPWVKKDPATGDSRLTGVGGILPYFAYQIIDELSLPFSPGALIRAARRFGIPRSNKRMYAKRLRAFRRGRLPKNFFDSPSRCRFAAIELADDDFLITKIELEKSARSATQVRAK